ncbi:MAG: amino acid ABC transporter substrate-binding protein [Chloroflexota bacterium]|jgi:general L-amino acid transport system substrate-binding protein
MKKKRLVLISALLLVALILAACQQQEPETVEVEVTRIVEIPVGEGEIVEVTREVEVEVTRIVEAPAEERVEEEAQEEPETMAAAGGEIYQRVLDRGRLVCGGRTDLAGFGYLDEAGRNIGFDIDLCRALAAAIFGDPEAVEFVPLTAAERGPALQTGEVDILSRNATWTTTRDAQWGNFTQIMFYDGQGYMVPVATGITTIEELDGATVCVTSGTTTELNLADSFRQRGLEFTPVVFEDTATVYGTYESGGCDATTSDKSQLAAVRSGFADPDAHTILDITISKEPLTPAVPTGDDQWFDIVKTVMYVLINAEELGVTSENVNEMVDSENINIRRMLGAEGEFGQADLGLDADFAVDVISAVGNYGEIYDRYMGPEGDAFTLPRGENDLWTNGGLIYAPPLR